MKQDLRRIESSLNKLALKSELNVSGPKVPTSTLNHFQAQIQQRSNPMMPKLESPQLKGNQNAANPALAMNILKNIEKVILRWQQELREVQQQIEAIYRSGPIVDG